MSRNALIDLSQGFRVDLTWKAHLPTWEGPRTPVPPQQQMRFWEELQQPWSLVSVLFRSEMRVAVAAIELDSLHTWGWRAGGGAGRGREQHLPDRGQVLAVTLPGPEGPSSNQNSLAYGDKSRRAPGRVNGSLTWVTNTVVASQSIPRLEPVCRARGPKALERRGGLVPVRKAPAKCQRLILWISLAAFREGTCRHAAEWLCSREKEIDCPGITGSWFWGDTSSCRATMSLWLASQNRGVRRSGRRSVACQCRSNSQGAPWVPTPSWGCFSGSGMCHWNRCGSTWQNPTVVPDLWSEGYLMVRKASGSH